MNNSESFRSEKRQQGEGISQLSASEINSETECATNFKVIEERSLPKTGFLTTKGILRETQAQRTILVQGGWALGQAYRSSQH